MRNLRYIIFVFTLFVAGCNRANSDFNSEWEFCLAQIDSELYDLDNAAQQEWRDVLIPHDWSIECGYTEDQTSGSNAFLPGGVGWYRKSFNVDSEMISKRVFVRFEGVYNNSQVWINGVDLGFYPNGYLDFEYELTPYLTIGENKITVRVDRRAYSDARWYVGAGIYRPVHLIVREDSYIPTHGQLITTSDITTDSAKVDIVTDIQNGTLQRATYQIKYSISQGGDLITEQTTSVDIDAQSCGTSTSSITLSNPQYWSIDTPNIYTLRTAVICDNKVVDNIAEEFGVRTIEFNADQGFLLNGKLVKLKGANIHHDLGCVGVALYDDILYRRLHALKSVGVNAIRTAHNPHSESLVKMCDTMGFVVMDEAFDEWREAKEKIVISRAIATPLDSLQIGYSQYFEQWAERDLKHFVRRDFNSPSVVMWSIGNEIEWTYKYYAGASLDKRGYQGLIFTGEYEVDPLKTKARFEELSEGNDELSRTARDLTKWIKEVDTSRPVTSGIVVPSVSHVSGYTDVLDVVGYNYKHTYYEPHHQMYPNTSIIGSENVGQYYEWQAVVDKPYIAGIFLWTGVDYMGENGPFPAKGGEYSLFDFATFKTPRGHFFETLWCDAPKTYMVTTEASKSEFKLQSDGSFKGEWDVSYGFIRRWLWFKCYQKWNYTKGEGVIVQVYTNAPRVELLLNGKSLGIKDRSDFSQENIILWQVPYVDGEVVAIGRDEDGKELSRYQLSTTGAPVKIKATVSRGVIDKRIAFIEIEIVDSNDNLVIDGEEQIDFELDRNWRIVGVDNGSDMFVGNHFTNSITTSSGRALIILQSNDEERSDVDITFITKLDLSSEVINTN